MTLRPSATITLGNLQYTEQALAVTATLTTLPGMNSFTVTLPAGVRLDAQPNDDAALELASGDADGAGADTIITGKVRAFRRGLYTVDVISGDAGAELARLRPCATYEKQSAKDVIRALASDAGISTDKVDINLPLAAYAAHQQRTAAEHVAYLARLGGCLAYMSSGGELNVTSWPEGQPEQALKYGREILSYDIREFPATQARRMMIGHGTAGSTSAPDVLRPSVDPLPGDAPKPGKDAIWTPTAALRVPQAAITASAGADAVVGAYGKRVHARCFLLPKLRPGLVIEVQNLPNDLSKGSWIITRVTHRLQPGIGGTTLFEGVSGEGGGLAGLLGATLGAIGSLF